MMDYSLYDVKLGAGEYGAFIIRVSEDSLEDNNIKNVSELISAEVGIKIKKASKVVDETKLTIDLTK